MKLAAIDIGSNAARLQITNVLHDGPDVHFKKVEYVRFPLRLGHDVFTIKRISPEREEKLVKLLHSFKLLMELHEVKDYYICATSAMRESANCSEVSAHVQSRLGMKIHVIDGSKEAELTNKAIITYLSPDKNYIHIDVGGGSTELNLYINKEKVAAKSFKLGSVRHLEHSESPVTWRKMKEWIEDHVLSVQGTIIAVGTGGNISKIYDMAERKEGNAIPREEVVRVQTYIAGYTLEERINHLQLNPDRADVIVPATDIYLSAMKWAKATEIIVPDVGLKDGIIQMLFEKHNQPRQIKAANRSSI
ncbi:phosphatase [Rhodocytophaga aerolata]|uniref:Phosphatase n=1 Tax=Rhodocytophaga aerolata TaxID=455078 RepID=A0ABT8RC51_9BACT|nr:phosphatase [Rhodocytophaga aerolata]MDO1448793.1 phosphatase [Rhodocytophaga aerolata]